MFLYKKRFVRYFVLHRAKLLHTKLLYRLHQKKGRLDQLRHSFLEQHYLNSSRDITQIHERLLSNGRDHFNIKKSHKRGKKHLRRHKWYKGPHFGYTHNLQNPNEKLSFLKVDLPHLKKKKAMVKFMKRNWQKMLSYKKRWLFKEVNILSDINTTLLHFDNLPKQYQIRLERCKLELAPALQRCESLHGKGNCEK